MNYIDVALIVLIVVIGFRGFASGFVAEFCSLAGILLGVYLGSVFAVPFGSALKSIYDFNSYTIHTALGFIIVLLVCWLIFVLIGIILAKKLQFSGLDFINKALGFVFSSIKVFFVFSFIAYAISHINFVKENFAKKAQENSQMYVNMIKVADSIMRFPVVDETLQNLGDITEGKTTAKSIQEGLEQVKKTTQDSAASLTGDNK
ncbi:hypothetical protein BKN38_04540 [Helicobacter sp. CLO-3]|uniref:CvpA family protein n=1 Tax=unclassified Helicobacter TaxID=2593540 RepID=UPI000805B180|nr:MULTISPECIES: CvpA family protein [unclassified Helicobacter]OBV29813.1 hypothetical protein BA723_04035 [Helicobacter sp. CLO-3]OHU83963.1 hypothetical protein BKN38_04540 [Helicobacter sp. CLO-3]